MKIKHKILFHVTEVWFTDKRNEGQMDTDNTIIPLGSSENESSHKKSKSNNRLTK